MDRNLLPVSIWPFLFGLFQFSVVDLEKKEQKKKDNKISFQTIFIYINYV